PMLTVAAVSGAIFAAVMATIGGVILAVMGIVGAKTMGPNATRFFYILSTNLGITTVFGAALLLGASGILMVRTRMLSPWLGWFGILIAVVSLFGGMAIATTRSAVFDLAFVSFLGTLLWVLIASILMLRHAPEAA